MFGELHTGIGCRTKRNNAAFYISEAYKSFCAAAQMAYKSYCVSQRHQSRKMKPSALKKLNRRGTWHCGGVSMTDYIVGLRAALEVGII